MSDSRNLPRDVDLVVAGAGVVGLSVAWEGVRRGRSVLVVERHARAVGASVRNFGHGCVTAQTGLARQYARAGRAGWLRLRDEAGLPVRECGTLVVARRPEEAAVLEEFVAANPTTAILLGPDETRARAPIHPDDVVAGAFLSEDLVVDPRTAVPVLAAHLAGLGVEFRYGVCALGADTGVLHTNRGDLAAGQVVLALGHDLDTLLPDPCEQAGLRRCQLHMLRVAGPRSFRLPSALLTGTSLLRYDGFLACPSSAALRTRLQAEDPALLAAGVNLMITPMPDGDLLIGDSHTYERTPSPFATEELDDLLLREARRLLGPHALAVRERWLGVYASTPAGAYLTPSPAPGVIGAAVTSGIGMTTAFGLGPAVLDRLDASWT